MSEKTDYLLLDFDGVDPKYILEDLKKINREYDVETLKICMSSEKENHYHAVITLVNFIDIMDAVDYLKQLHVDKHYLDKVMEHKTFFLREDELTEVGIL